MARNLSPSAVVETTKRMSTVYIHVVCVGFSLFWSDYAKNKAKHSPKGSGFRQLQASRPGRFAQAHEKLVGLLLACFTRTSWTHSFETFTILPLYSGTGAPCSMTSSSLRSSVGLSQRHSTLLSFVHADRTLRQVPAAGQIFNAVVMIDLAARSIHRRRRTEG